MSKKLADLTPEQVEEERAKRRAYYQRNRVRLLAHAKAAQKRRWEENPERERAKHRAFYKSHFSNPVNRQARRERSQRYYAKHREQVLLNALQRRQADPEGYRVKVRAWRAARKKRMSGDS